MPGDSLFFAKARPGNVLILLKVNQLHELLDAIFDLLVIEFGKALDAEFLHAKGCHGGPVDNCPLHILKAGIPGSGQVAHETARKGVARTGGIVHFGKWKGGRKKDALLLE